MDIEDTATTIEKYYRAIDRYDEPMYDHFGCDLKIIMDDFKHFAFLDYLLVSEKNTTKRPKLLNAVVSKNEGGQYDQLLIRVGIARACIIPFDLRRSSTRAKFSMEPNARHRLEEVIRAITSNLRQQCYSFSRILDAVAFAIVGAAMHEVATEERGGPATKIVARADKELTELRRQEILTVKLDDTYRGHAKAMADWYNLSGLRKLGGWPIEDVCSTIASVAEWFLAKELNGSYRDCRRSMSKKRAEELALKALIMGDELHMCDRSSEAFRLAFDLIGSTLLSRAESTDWLYGTYHKKVISFIDKCLERPDRLEEEWWEKAHQRIL